MTSPDETKPLDPNVRPKGYKPPTSAKELLERYANGERYSPLQKSTERGFTLIELAIILAAIGFIAFMVFRNPGCGCSSGDSSNTEGTLKVGYTPPFSPLSLELKTSGELQVVMNGRIVTPVGTFSMEWERKKVLTLEITLGGETRFYPLGKEKLRITLPNSLTGRSQVRYDGEGNIRIIIPAPGNTRFPD